MDETRFRQALEAALAAGGLDSLSAKIARKALVDPATRIEYREELLEILRTSAATAARNYYAGSVDQSQHNTTNTGVDARESTNTFVEQQHIHQSLPEGVDLNVLLKGYYETLSAESNKVALPDADNVDASQHQVVLSAIYTTLEVARSVEYVTEHHATASRLVKVFEAINDHQRMVLLGDPGSGKSTCVNFLVYGLAQHELRKLKGDQAAPDPLVYLEREGWSSGSRIPIRVLLSDFTRWLQEHPDLPGGANLLWWYLDSRYDSHVSMYLREQTDQQNTIIVFDGLDEVPAGDTGLLARTQALLEDLSQKPHLRILVTCRTLDYQADQRYLLHWPTEHIIPFSPRLQHAFIERWYTVLAQLGRPMLGQAPELCTRLKQAVRQRHDVKILADNPLLLTMMALLHAAKGELPHNRIILYQDYIELLRTWQRHKQPNNYSVLDHPTLEETISAAGIRTWQHQDTDRLLMYLGYNAQTQIKPRQKKAAASDIHITLLVQEATAFFSRPIYGADYATATTAAQAVLDYVHTYDTGILHFFKHDILRFPHRIFQEYLAACYLTDDTNHELERDVVARLLHYIDQPAWREVLLLSGSKLMLDGRFREAVGLVEAIAQYTHHDNPTWPAYILLAGELMLKIGQETFAAVDQSELWNYIIKALQECKKPMHTASQSMLDKILRRPQQSTIIPAPSRVQAARVLSQLRDPSLRKIPLEPQWCHVPAGTFLCGSNPQRDRDAQEDEQPQHEVYLPAFAIAAHPVTNTEFGRFIDAKGYDNRDWWTDEGWAKHISHKQPLLWYDDSFNAPDQPVVGVTWYEALAYCAWLSAELGYLITLPTEAQWEKAARGTDGRIYPWGNRFDQDRVNCSKLYGSTTPIGCFPQGRSPYDCYDMAGNVWEWTLSQYHIPHQYTAEMTISKKNIISFRGGAWTKDAQDLRCARKMGFDRLLRTQGIGFRVLLETAAAMA